jgi:hypothetical protein
MNHPIKNELRLVAIRIESKVREVKEEQPRGVLKSE